MMKICQEAQQELVMVEVQNITKMIHMKEDLFKLLSDLFRLQSEFPGNVRGDELGV